MHKQKGYAKTKEGLMRNLTMLELADNKLSLAFDHDIAMSLVDAFHDQMGDTIFTNQCEKISMAEILSRARSARDRGEVSQPRAHIGKLDKCFQAR